MKRRLSILTWGIIGASLPWFLILAMIHGWLLAALAFIPIYFGMLLVYGLTLYLLKHENN